MLPLAVFQFTLSGCKPVVAVCTGVLDIADILSSQPQAEFSLYHWNVESETLIVIKHPRVDFGTTGNWKMQNIQPIGNTEQEWGVMKTDSEWSENG